MTGYAEPLDCFGGEVQDAAEETSLIFTSLPPNQDLGMLDAKAETIELTIAGRDFTIRQSPGLLRSDREGGTTGAVVWQTSVRVAEWLSLSDNILYKHGFLRIEGVVLELGSGVSGLVPYVLASKVGTVLATDQPYVLRLLKENLRGYRQSKPARKGVRRDVTDVGFLPLDWETDDIKSLLAAWGHPTSVDVVLACDCIYNYALIDPFIQTCVDFCKLRQNYLQAHTVPHLEQLRPTICIVAQHLRQPDVFEQWLEAFLHCFRVWRVRDNDLTERLREESGFVVHVGMLR